MDPRVRTVLDAHGGVASALQLREVGVSRHVLRRLVARKEVLRLPRGIILDPAVWADRAPWQRHALRARGLMLGPVGSGSAPTALSHHSALSIMGVPLFAVDDRVHVVRTDGRRIRTDTIVRAHAPVEPEWVEVHHKLRTVKAALAVAQVAATSGFESGLVSADACLRAGLSTKEQLREAANAAPLGNGRGQAQQVADFADGSAESAGESRCRWAFVCLGLPRPIPQAEIRDATGSLIARVDFLFEEQGVVVEFDGRVKYGDPKTLFQEKQREDALRALGYIVVRVTWADLAHPQRILLRISQAFQTARS